MFSLLQWNVLSQKRATQIRFPYANPEHLDKKYRIELYSISFLNLKPNIVCLQECDFYDDLKEKIPSMESHITDDHIAIFWNPDMFREVRYFADKGYQLLELEKRDEKKCVTIINVHFDAPTIVDINRIIKAGNQHNTVICGDFGLNLRSPTLSKLLDNYHVASHALLTTYKKTANDIFRQKIHCFTKNVKSVNRFYTGCRNINSVVPNATLPSENIVLYYDFEMFENKIHNHVKFHKKLTFSTKLKEDLFDEKDIFRAASYYYSKECIGKLMKVDLVFPEGIFNIGYIGTTKKLEETKIKYKAGKEIAKYLKFLEYCTSPSFRDTSIYLYLCPVSSKFENYATELLPGLILQRITSYQAKVKENT